jgi:hypothetical protein
MGNAKVEMVEVAEAAAQPARLGQNSVKYGDKLAAAEALEYLADKLFLIQ